MKKIYFILTTLFIGSILFCACDESDDGSGEGDPIEKQCYISKVYEDDALALEMTWNADNQLTMVDFYDEKGIKSGYLAITWADGKVTKTEEFSLDEKTSGLSNWSPDILSKLEKLGIKSFSSDMYQTYAYTDDKVTQSDMFQYDEGEWVNFGYYNFEYTGDNITKATFKYFREEVAVDLYYNTYAYDANGNLTENKSYILSDNSKEDVLEYANTYTYDDKNAAFGKNGLPMMEAFLISPNNILTEIELEYDIWDGGTGELSSTYEYTHIYTYNEDNYPMTEVFTNITEGESVNSTIEYNCTE